jgi:thymidylate synthase (FAD)
MIIELIRDNITMLRKPKLLIIGHARHGKDTVAELIKQRMGLRFESSSYVLAEEVVYPTMKEKYSSWQECFEDRANHRVHWHNVLKQYNTPDPTKLAKLIMSNNDIYVGMRSFREMQACLNNKMFDLVIWVDGSKRHELEGIGSFDIPIQKTHFHINNNYSLDILYDEIDRLREYLYMGGFNVEDNPIRVNRTWLDKPEGSIIVLDHGFIELKEVMGSDQTIVESASMSYGRGTKRVSNDEALIRYLMINNHTSPIEMGEMRFHMRLPIFVMRQVIRHRTANVNEYSGRYSEMVRLFYTPKAEQIKGQHKTNKQGSGEQLSDIDIKTIQLSMEQISNHCFDTYEALLKLGLSRETARIILPLNTYTECVWKLDTSNLIKFLFLRDDSHAQWEVRQYAKEIAKQVEIHFPLLYKAYMRKRNSITLTEVQIEALIQGKILPDMPKGEAQQVREILEKYS